MKMKRGLFPSAVLLLIGWAMFSSAQTPPQKVMVIDTVSVVRAAAVVYPASGSQVHGTVTFEKAAGGIHVVADLSGLTPGEHGFHVHLYGDCSSADASSAGEHFNPMHMSHGAPADKSRHEGDLGNLTADANGKARFEWTDPMLSFSGSASIIGRSVVVHGGPDDLKSQPAGNSGPRVGCGVIGIAK